MTEAMSYRLAADRDLPALADLRWRLQTDDRLEFDQEDYDQFVAAFINNQRSEWRPGEIVHWIAVHGGRPVAAMSVVIVRKVPRPGELHGRWGYLTNCYALPDVRDQGCGTALLAAVKRWAVDENLEMLVVWPSDRAYPFYERSGFQRPPDPLVLDLAQV